VTAIEAAHTPVVEATSAGPIGPEPAVRVRRLVRPVALVLVVLVVVVLIALVQAAGGSGYLDPDSAAPAGGRALRVLLQEQGVRVTSVTTTTAAAGRARAGSTLLVVAANRLTTGQLRHLAGTGADLVLVDPDDRTLSVLAPGLGAAGSTVEDVRTPDCALPAAVHAGRAVTGGLTMSAGPGAGRITLCYPDGGDATVAAVYVPGRRSLVVAVGSGAGFTNDQLAREGDAALALNLLGGNPDLTWYVASTELSPTGGTKSLGELLPPWVGVVVVQLLVCVLLAAMWRGRRLGPAVVEPLPVVVRAAEATEGRARLYRRGGARDRAAQHLREAAVARLLPLVGAPAGAERAGVVALVAARSSWSAPDVDRLLYGAAPPDDTSLVRLASQLDDLERTVRRR
jgi:Domain of unknown function (DUF4350)